MVEISRIVLVLLLEGLVLFAAATLLLAAMAIARRRRKAKAVAQLAEQVRHQSSVRREQTGSYLEAIYHLEDEELHQAIGTIDRQEKRFFQYMIDVIYHEDSERIVSLDAALAELIDTYKNMRPREQFSVEAEQTLLAENESLKASNQKLRDELAITKETLTGMIAEFGNMFGGGADHELAKHEVVEQMRGEFDKARLAETGARPADDGAGETRDAGGADPGDDGRTGDGENGETLGVDLADPDPDGAAESAA